MHVSNETRATHAALVPVYVRAAGEAWELVDTASDDALSTHATSRIAAWSALDREAVGGDSDRRENGAAAGFIKRANLRKDGEPIGAWRWLDATAEEDAPIGGTRITAEAIWEMAAHLNGRKSAVPVNGGPAPKGYAESLPHGDAYFGGDHPANGYAHVGLPILDEDGRTHLALFVELLPNVAREVDSGRLAYGSIRFDFESVDHEDNDAIQGAILVSHALTNDPAVTTLTAGSERRRSGQSRFTACRGREVRMPGKQTGQRGPASEILSKLAEMLGISPEQFTEDPWSLTDAIYALQSAEKVEEIIEAAGEVPAEPSGDSAEMQARAVLRGVVRAAKIAKREVEGVEPEEVDPMLASFVELAGEVLDKPDAEPAELLAELEARKAEIADALGNDAPEADPATEPADDPDEEGREEGDEDEEEREKGKDKPGADKDPEMFAKPGSDDEDDKFAKKSAREMRTIAASLRERAEKAEAELKAEREKVARFETATWLDEAISARQLPMPKTEREKLLKVAIEKGRDVAEMILDARNRPPSHNPMGNGGAPVRHQPRSYRESVDLCMAEARERLPQDAAPQVVRAAAQRIAAERFPEIAQPSAEA